MTVNELKFLIIADLYRIQGKTDSKTFYQNLLINPGFKVAFWIRVCAYLRQHQQLKHSLYHVVRVILQHEIVKYGIDISHRTQIQSGLLIVHYGGIVVNSQAIIGKNCTISHGVTVGEANRGRNKGFPVIGDNVYIGPGAKIVGNVHIGNDVAIGANCVVTKDIPDHAVVVGVPGRAISSNGAQDYVNRTDYEELAQKQVLHDLLFPGPFTKYGGRVFCGLLLFLLYIAISRSHWSYKIGNDPLRR
jgi:serine O-acetyltransferase